MIALTLIIIGIFARLAPHIPNVTPVTAAALFGGTQLPKRIAVIVPLSIMVLSDFVIGFDSLESRIAVYGCFMVTSVIGLWLRSHRSAKTIAFAAVSSSILFFLVTNAEVWAFSGMYARNIGGLIEAYLMGLPFLRNMLVGDVGYTTIFFGMSYIAARITRPSQIKRFVI